VPPLMSNVRRHEEAVQIAAPAFGFGCSHLSRCSVRSAFRVVSAITEKCFCLCVRRYPCTSSLAPRGRPVGGQDQTPDHLEGFVFWGLCQYSLSFPVWCWSTRSWAGLRILLSTPRALVCEPSLAAHRPNHGASAPSYFYRTQMTPNPSIERTPYGTLRVPAVAAHVER
jgi:hypothetical protein